MTPHEPNYYKTVPFRSYLNVVDMLLEAHTGKESNHIHGSFIQSCKDDGVSMIDCARMIMSLDNKQGGK